MGERGDEGGGGEGKGRVRGEVRGGERGREGGEVEKGGGGGGRGGGLGREGDGGERDGLGIEGREAGEAVSENTPVYWFPRGVPVMWLTYPQRNIPIDVWLKGMSSSCWMALLE